MQINEKEFLKAYTHTFTINKEKGIITKRLTDKRLCEDSFNTYKEMTMGNSNYVQVYDIIDEYTYTMEYIPNVLDHLGQVLKHERYNYLLTKKFIIDAFSVFHNMFLDSLKLTKLYHVSNHAQHKQKEYFINTDSKLANIVITKDGNFKIIDPDSYMWITPENFIGGITQYCMAQINLAMHLQKSLIESSKKGNRNGQDTL